MTKAAVSDENKFHLSVVDETLWQAAERTLTPMWEIATTGNDVTQAISPVTPSSNMDENYLDHDKVSGKMKLLTLHVHLSHCITFSNHTKL